MLSLNVNTKGVIIAFYAIVFLGCLNVSFASAREIQPEQGKQEVIESRIAEVKLQLLRKIVRSSTNDDLIWLSPEGMTIVLRQSDRVSQTLQTLTLRGSSANRVFNKSHKYALEEATALRKGGAYRAPRIGHLESDLSITATASMVNFENESHQIKTTVSIKREYLPTVVELMIVPSPEGPKFKKRIMRKPTPTQIKELLTRHIQYLIDTESYLEAAVLVLTVLEKRSKEFDPKEKWKLQLAKVYLEWGMDVEAERLLNQMIASGGLKQDTPTALYYLGKLRYRQGDYKKATEYLLEARAGLAPSFLPEVLYLAGNSLLHQGSYSKAVEHLGQVPKGNRLYPFALFSIGLAHLKPKETSSAIKQFQRLIELDFNNGELREFLVHRAHITLGFFLVDEGQFKEALESFSNIPPNSLYADQAQFGVGWAYFKKGDCDKAVVVFQDLVSQWPDSIYSQEARLKVGTCYAELLAYRRAVESYQEALRSYSVENEILNTLQDDLAKEPLSLWLKAQREKKLGSGKKSAFIRNLSAEKSVQKAIAAFEGIEDLTAQMSRLENNIADVSLLDSPGQQLQQLHRESEIEVKKVISERIEDLQKLLEKRSVQADIGLLKNFRLVD
jgi:tetratricopeptide (TPR) repeat protein